MTSRALLEARMHQSQDICNLAGPEDLHKTLKASLGVLTGNALHLAEPGERLSCDLVLLLGVGAPNEPVEVPPEIIGCIACRQPAPEVRRHCYTASLHLRHHGQHAVMVPGSLQRPQTGVLKTAGVMRFTASL